MVHITGKGLVLLRYDYDKRGFRTIERIHKSVLKEELYG